MSTNEEDYVEYLLNLHSHDFVMIFTNKGKVYKLKGYEIPEFNRTSKGIPVVNLLPIEKEEKIQSIIPYNKEDDFKFLIFATKFGIVKRTELSEFDNIRKTGKLCIKLKENDELVSVRKTTGLHNVMLAAESGRMVVFNEKEIRVMGRTASGVKGISLDNSKCISMEAASDDDNIILVTTKGYGKKTLLSEYRKTKRGSKGVKALNITAKNGTIVSIKKCEENTDLMLITNTGIIIRIPTAQISQLGRVTQGTKLINLKDGQSVSSISLVTADDVSRETLEEDESQE